ncbi:MAG: hypothetical protein ACLFM4_09330 [Phormidium sp.]|nr:MAG: Apolipoprotein A1/A4/E domain [Phormidium sp. OSCR]
MEDWITEWVNSVEKTVEAALEQTAESFETWTDEVVDQVDKQLQELLVWSQDCSDEMYQQLQQLLPLDEVSQDLDRTLDEWLEGLDALFAEDYSWDGNLRESEQDSDPFVQITYVEPSKSQNPACINCRHYHGHQYGDTLFVCGMHPYGWDGEDCPDWENVF